jgi:hypothetical protein
MKKNPCYAPPYIIIAIFNTGGQNGHARRRKTKKRKKSEMPFQRLCCQPRTLMRPNSGTVVLKSIGEDYHIEKWLSMAIWLKKSRLRQFVSVAQAVQNKNNY